MSGSTGTPMNLNTFAGTDDIVKALTDLFNQNMNLINNGDIHTKVWRPNTAYQKGDVVMHPYQSKLIYAYNSHTSSNSNTEAYWGANDGSKWASLSFTPNVIPWQPNNYFQGGDVFFDGNELKKATQTGASQTLDRTASAFVGSRVANWTPNTKYNVGDLALIKSLNADNTENGRILNGLMICNTTHISGTTFPASSDNTWTLLNQNSSYMLTKHTDNLVYDIAADATRVGSQVSLSVLTSNHSNIPNTSGGWKNLPDKLYDYLKAAARTRLEFFGGPAQAPGMTIQFDGINMRFGSSTSMPNGYWLHAQGNYPTDSAPMWNTGVPVQ